MRSTAIPMSLHAHQPVLAAQPRPRKVAAHTPAQPATPPASQVHIPKRLSERFDLALQCQALPWVDCEHVVNALWAQRCTFKDPVVTLHTRQAFVDYLHVMDRVGKIPRVDIDEKHLEGNVGTATGTLYFQPIKGPTMAAHFTTRMEFDAEGRIVKQEDQWNVLKTLVAWVLGRGKMPPEQGAGRA